MQQALFVVYRTLSILHKDTEYIWNKDKIKKWADKPASEAQLTNIKKYVPNCNYKNLTKGEASQVLNRAFYRKESHNLSLLLA